MNSMRAVLIKQLTEYNFDLNRVRHDVLNILEEHNFISQIGLTHTPAAKTHKEKILESTGSVMDFETGKFKFKETDFCMFNDAYKDTYLYHIYSTIPNIGRFRIMTMNGPSCYSIHKDLSKRYHYVVETNPDCLFLFPEFAEQIHIPADGKLYLTNTLHRHTYVNGSKSRRIHLVFDDLTTLKNVGNI